MLAWIIEHKLHSWLSALLLATVSLATPLTAAIVPLGDVQPAVIGPVTPIVTVGNTDIGSLLVDAGSVLASSFSTLGQEANSLGAAEISGAGSKWTNSGFLIVGDHGYGTLTVDTGAQVTSDSGAYVGRQVEGLGIVTITGAGSQWTSRDLDVGISGNGTLIIEAGGKVTNWRGSVGVDTSSVGAVTVTGADSQWINNSALAVNYGTLTVADGGKVVTGELRASVNDLDGDGTITATRGGVLDAEVMFDAAHETEAIIPFGSGGTLVFHAGPLLGVGYKQNGHLTISEGVSISSNTGILGSNYGSSGTATITGEGSIWAINKISPTSYVGGTLTVGSLGSGTLNIEAGAKVSNATGIVGYIGNSNGKVKVSGAGSEWISSQSLTVGDNTDSNGTLMVDAGGLVTSGSGALAYWAGSTGSATVTGAGSKWALSGSFAVGRTGGATLAIEAGGQISSTAGSLGTRTGSAGTAVVTGNGSKWSNSGSLTVGQNGSGALIIDQGGLVTVGGTLTIDTNLDGDSFIDMATGGMLALYGDVDDSLDQFLGLVSGTDAIRYWDASLSNWTPLTQATYGDQYSLSYITDGDLTGYTLLTVGRVADFDGDGDVDGRDFLAWQRSPNSGSLADWQDNYGDSELLVNSVGIPEPSSCSMLACIMIVSLSHLLKRRN